MSLREIKEKIYYEIGGLLPITLHDITEVDISYLKDSQRRVFGDIMNCQEDVMLLTGSAGTGKTTLANYVIRAFCYANKHKVRGMQKLVAVTAPTHKAVKVLRGKCNLKASYLEFKTIHSILGFREQINPDGTLTFVPTGKSTIDKYQLVVVDEASMIVKELFNLIMAAQITNGFKLLFIGDLKQLPPVKEAYSLCFSSGFAHFELTEIIRQGENNPLMNLINNPMEEVFKQGEIIGTKGWFKVTGEDFKETIVDFYKSNSYQNDSSFVRCLCWTNKWVAYINSFIRAELFGTDIDRFVIGDRLIMKSPYVEGDQIILNNAEEVEVIGIEYGDYELQEGLSLECYFLKVAYYDLDNSVKYATVKAISERSQAEYDKILDAVKGLALSYDSRDYRRSETFKQWYKIKELFIDFQYAYAQTVHTSQGSTYHNVFIFVEDLDKNKNFDEKKKLVYTAKTRASNFCGLVKKEI